MADLIHSSRLFFSCGSFVRLLVMPIRQPLAVRITRDGRLGLRIYDPQIVAKNDGRNR